MATATDTEPDVAPRAGASSGFAATRDTPVRVAIVDDHQVLLDSLGGWIRSNAPEFEVAVLATSWLELVHDPHFPTDLVLLDLQPREQVSIEARVRTCRAAGAKVIVMSGVESPAVRQRALAAGADDFVSKAAPVPAVMEIARAVVGLTPGAAEVHHRPLPLVVDRPKLSPGEQAALLLYVSGLSTGDVAGRMGVRYETAKTYLRRVREKYARVGRPASRKADLVRRAAEDGLLE
jgi:DNA-binding NarL/FixJ family response regulator